MGSYGFNSTSVSHLTGLLCSEVMTLFEKWLPVEITSLLNEVRQNYSWALCGGLETALGYLLLVDPHNLSLSVRLTDSPNWHLMTGTTQHGSRMTQFAQDKHERVLVFVWG
jgi:hypothetical protein